MLCIYRWFFEIAIVLPVLRCGIYLWNFLGKKNPSAFWVLHKPLFPAIRMRYLRLHKLNLVSLSSQI